MALLKAKTQTKTKQAPAKKLVPKPPARPSLNSVARAVARDAKQASLQYVLRSDTGHDGE